MPTWIGKWLLIPAVLVVFLLVWEIGVAVFNAPRYLLPPPSVVFKSFADNWSAIAYESGFTLYATLAGFGLSILIGVPLAVAIVYSKPLERVLYPLLVASQAIPKVAIAPLLLVWLGYGTAPKIVVAFLIAFFPIVVNTASGLNQVNSEMLRLAASMGMKPWDVFRRLRFPMAVPSMMSGFKVAIALAVVGAVVGEFVGSRNGLGYMIMVATGNFNTALVFACILTLTVMGITLFYLIVLIDKKLSWWANPDDTAGIPAAVGTA